MDLLKITYFVEVAACGSFTQAARQLYTSQPNISKQISSMEHETGVKLFERTSRSVELTPAGKYLYEQLRDIPTLTQQAFEQARAIDRSSHKRVSIGILEGQGINDLLLSQLRSFSDTEPGVQLDLARSSFRNLRMGLERGYYDMIITFSFETSAFQNVCSQTILAQSGAIAMHKSNPLSQRQTLTLDLLRQEGFVAISPEESPLGYAQLFRQCQAYGFTPRIARLATTLESLLLLVEANIGVTLLDTNTRLSASSDVRVIPIPGSARSDLVALWYREKSSPLLQRLAASLQCQDKGKT